MPKLHRDIQSKFNSDELPFAVIFMLLTTGIFITILSVPILLVSPFNPFITCVLINFIVNKLFLNQLLLFCSLCVFISNPWLILFSKSI